MIHQTTGGYFAEVPGMPGLIGPFRSRDHAERMIANVATRAQRRAQPRPPREMQAAIEPRVVVAAAEGSLPRHERRARIAKKRVEARSATRRAKAQKQKAALKAAQENQAAQEAEGVLV